MAPSVTPTPPVPLITPDRVERSIVVLRRRRVIFDRDLAVFYGVTTGNLNKAVSRNIARFPADFMLVLNKDELANLIFQTGISSRGYGGTR
jgi:hypothetical protein